MFLDVFFSLSNETVIELLIVYFQFGCRVDFPIPELRYLGHLDFMVGENLIVWLVTSIDRQSLTAF